MTEQIRRDYIIQLMEKKFEEKLKPLEDKLNLIIKMLQKEKDDKN